VSIFQAFYSLYFI